MFIHYAYNIRMYIAAIPNRNAPPAILIRESYRDHGKVKSRTIANISSWDPARIESLRSALQITLPDALASLSRLCLLHCPVNADTTVTRLPRPDVRQKQILTALGVMLPEKQAGDVHRTWPYKAQFSE
jgi:hypothetical protein